MFIKASHPPCYRQRSQRNLNQNQRTKVQHTAMQMEPLSSNVNASATSKETPPLSPPAQPLAFNYLAENAHVQKLMSALTSQCP